MPDLQTALNNALLKKEIINWDNEEKQRMPKSQMPGNTFSVTNNVMRTTFDHVVNNPGLTSPQHVELLVKKGFKEKSLVSVLSQLVRTGQVTKTDERKLYAVSKVYRPINNRINKLAAKIAAKAGNTHQSVAAKPEVKHSKGIAALEAQGKKEPVSIIVNHNWSAQGVVDKLSVMQARKLYDLLKEIFGG